MSTPILPNALKAAHSKGPWRMDDARIRDGSGNLIGFIYPTELLFKSEHDANVNLAISAPDLLHEADFAAAQLASLTDEIEDGINQCNELNPRIIVARLRNIAIDLGKVARTARGESR